MPIHMSVFERTHRSYGLTTHGSVIASLLERTQPKFGSGLTQIYVELVCRSPSRIGTPIEADEAVMGTLLVGLPKSRLSVKAKRYSITVLSHLAGAEPLPISTMQSFSAEDIQRRDAQYKAEHSARIADRARKLADVDAMFRVFDELVAAMVAKPPKLKSITFNWPGFVEWFTSLRAELPTTLEGVRAASAAGHAAAKSRFEAMDPWTRLEIDWSVFHPDARQLLPEPFYWTRTDDFAPHGNDEGSDVLAEMLAHARTTEFNEGAFESLARQFEHTTQIEIADADACHRTRYLDFIIAVSFGHIKLKGFCPPWLQERTLAAIEREVAALDVLIERDALGVPLSTWDGATARHRVPRRDSLKKLSAALERIPVARA